MFLLLITAVFLILLVLIQRGRGGGLAGAFGGLGGQSAFGTKAGDVFTKITIYVAAFWIVLCVASVKLLKDSGNPLASGLGQTSDPGDPKATDKGGAAASSQNTKDDAKSADSAASDTKANGSASATEKAASTDAAPASESSPGDSK